MRAGRHTLAAAFARAWSRQPAALAEGERQRAVSAQFAAADRRTPAPGSLELGLRSDRFNRNQGASEVDVGVAIPLWLPGERNGAQALAAAAEGALAGGRPPCVCSWHRPCAMPGGNGN